MLLMTGFVVTYMCVCVYIQNIKIIYYYYFFFFLLLTNTLKPDSDVSGLLMGTCLMFKEKNTALKGGITISCVITPLNTQSSMLGMREMRHPTQKKLCPCIITVFSSNS